jgi:hypothetical protein
MGLDTTSVNATKPLIEYAKNTEVEKASTARSQSRALSWAGTFRQRAD